MQEYEDEEPCLVCAEPVNDDDYHTYGYCGSCSTDLRRVLEGDVNMIEGGLMEDIVAFCSSDTVSDLIRMGKLKRLKGLIANTSITKEEGVE